MKAEDFIYHYDVGGDYSNLFIMQEEGKGFIRISWYERDNNAYISDLSVDEDSRMNKIGTKLLLRAEEVIMLAHKQFSQLKVLKGSWMKDWYFRMGYLPLDCDENYLWMIKRLL